MERTVQSFTLLLLIRHYRIETLCRFFSLCLLVLLALNRKAETFGKVKDKISHFVVNSALFLVQGAAAKAHASACLLKDESILLAGKFYYTGERNTCINLFFILFKNRDMYFIAVAGRVIIIGILRFDAAE